MAVIALFPAPLPQLGALPAGPIEGLYVHVPFCFHKCHYCDFYSITRQTPERMNRFVDLLLAEAGQWEKSRPVDLLRPRTIFFGGGTPSLLPLESMDRLLGDLPRWFDLSQVDEWTVEVNPATASLDYCRMLKERGVTRLSLGAQSFNPSELATLERHHDPDDVPRSIDLARRAGFDRLNVDLIYAVPGQSVASWAASLESALELKTSHLSCYGLTYEPNTPMAVKKRLGVIRAVDDDLELEMMRHTRARLRGAGMDAYEISNYAVPGQQCRHNLMYWTGGNYLGLGPSAASHVEGWRWKNRPHLGEWERVVAGGNLPATDVESLTPLQRAGELAMLMLRLSGGLNFDTFAARTGYDALQLFAPVLGRLAESGLLHVERDAVRLSESGIPVADAISAEFLDVRKSA
jgi:oxygen-independent coproporphyrinogen-3 oxidase